MNLRYVTLHSITALGLLAGCASNQWHSSQHHDDFTDTNVCRVERTTEAQRSFARGFTGTIFSLHFFAENYNGEVRAGLRTEPPLPISGDAQIKVGEKLYTLTSQDVPLDVTPTIPTDTSAAEAAMGKAYADTIKNITRTTQQMASPYRAYTGKKATNMLRDITQAQGEIKFRTVGVNAATSGTGSFTVGPEFAKALSECGIKL